VSQGLFSGVLDALLGASLVLILAPGLHGLIKSLKARLQGRRGPGILQPYADLLKLLQKGSIVPGPTSWVFRAAPLVNFSATLSAALLLPTLAPRAPLGAGDLVLLVGLLALARFALALAALDTGSAFAGMGASREMAIAALVEPALLAATLALAIPAGGTDLADLAARGQTSGWLALGPAHLLAAGALVIVAIAETGRLPVDNPDTHLELTMVHEGMLLEYSGRPLALLVWAAQIKQLLVLGLLAVMVLPWGIGAPILVALPAYLLKLGALGAMLAAIETGTAKLRILRLPDLLATAFALGGLSTLAHAVFGG
jgi:formate hydrogenlyase subunit 4